MGFFEYIFKMSHDYLTIFQSWRIFSFAKLSLALMSSCIQAWSDPRFSRLEVFLLINDLSYVLFGVTESIICRLLRAELGATRRIRLLLATDTLHVTKSFYFYRVFLYFAGSLTPSFENAQSSGVVSDNLNSKPQPMLAFSCARLRCFHCTETAILFFLRFFFPTLRSVVVNFWSILETNFYRCFYWESSTKSSPHRQMSSQTRAVMIGH